MIPHPLMPMSDRIRQRLMRSIDYIERNITEDLTLTGVAEKAALSEYHFHRLFRARFGVPVIDYVRRRRISWAATALLESQASVLQIALDAGFESQAAFTRAFRRIYHISPARFRARGRDVPWLSSAPISEATLALFPGLGARQPTLRTIEPFEVAGLEARYDGTGRERIPQLWSDLAGIVGHGRFADSERIGISENDEAVLDGVLCYTAAIRPAPGPDVMEKLTRRTLSGGAYLVFTVEGSGRQISSAYDFIFGTWMPGSRHQLLPLPSFGRIGPHDRSLGSKEPADTAQIWIPVAAS